MYMYTVEPPDKEQFGDFDRLIVIDRAAVLFRRSPCSMVRFSILPGESTVTVTVNFTSLQMCVEICIKASREH